MIEYNNCFLTSKEGDSRGSVNECWLLTVE